MGLQNDSFIRIGLDIDRNRLVDSFDHIDLVDSFTRKHFIVSYNLLVVITRILLEAVVRKQEVVNHSLVEVTNHSLVVVISYNRMEVITDC